MKHTISWFEIPVTDFERACRFYERLIDTTLNIENYGTTGMRMAVFPGENDSVRGALVAGNDTVVSAENGVVIYLTSDSGLQTMLDRAQLVDDQILVPHTKLPGEIAGYIAHIRDCEGNRIGLFSLNA